ncbi:MAG: alpha/beta fold hydrolase [Candidatus Nanopelagicales bacterium]
MTLHYVESGSGPAVVLLHAFPLDSLLWSAQRKALGAAGYAAITPDLPGFGGSPLLPAQPGLDGFADEVVHLLDHLTVTQAAVAGLSMGGYVALNLLRRYPERVAALALVDTKVSADPPAASANRLEMADRLDSGWPSQELARAMLPGLLGETTRSNNPDLVGQVTRWIAAQDRRAVSYAQRAMAARLDSGELLAAYQGPVLVIRGVEDTLSTPADAAAMIGGDPAGPRELAEIPLSGHLSAVENPAAVTEALLAWLGEHAPKAQ